MILIQKINEKRIIRGEIMIINIIEWEDEFGKWNSRIDFIPFNEEFLCDSDICCGRITKNMLYKTKLLNIIPKDIILAPTIIDCEYEITKKKKSSNIDQFMIKKVKIHGEDIRLL